MATLFTLTLRDFENLALVRDELHLQMHLFKAELRDRWLDAEVRWARLQTEVRAVGASPDQSGTELGAVAGLLADALHKAYIDLRAALR